MAATCRRPVSGFRYSCRAPRFTSLAKLTPIDLHPRAFAPSQTALTLFGHLTGQITQIDDAPSYELMVFRGFAQCFWHAMHAAGAEFGIHVTETIR